MKVINNNKKKSVCCQRPVKLVASFDTQHVHCLHQGLAMQHHEDNRVLVDLCVRAAKKRLVTFLEYLLPKTLLTDLEMCYLVHLSRKSRPCVEYLNSSLLGQHPMMTYTCVDTYDTCVYLAKMHGWDARVADWLVRRMRFETLARLVAEHDYPLIENVDTCKTILRSCTDVRSLNIIMRRMVIPIIDYSECSAAVYHWLGLPDTQQSPDVSTCSIDRLSLCSFGDPIVFLSNVLARPDFNMRMIRHNISLSFFMYFLDEFDAKTSLTLIAHQHRRYNAMMYFGRRFGYDPRINVHTMKSKFQKKILNSRCK